jgi:uncharacterized membrane protein YeaQ/YmgE (transglycosylase-associated protein family)
VENVIGLLSWIGVGAAVGLASRFLLPGRPSWVVSLASSASGALLGGLVATLLEMGGTAELDPRALVISFLSALLAAIVAQLVRVVRGVGR